MNRSVKIYISTSVACFLVLVLVQFMLIYNTYELLNRRFYYENKLKINELYAKAIVNDKLFPGGQKIIDSAITNRYDTMETLYHTAPHQFSVYTQQMLDTLFARLIAQENVDSLLQQIKQKSGITDSLQYALYIHSIDLKFDTREYINIYNYKNRYAFIPAAIQENSGIRICSNLPVPDDQNRVLTLTITSPASYSYAISFSFYADPYNRQMTVLNQMKLLIFFSFMSVCTIVILFFVTLRNWLKQKHLSEMKSDFINNITHEFHTPLSAIMVANRNIQNEKIIVNALAVRPLTDIIQRQSERLKLLIGQVLDITVTDTLTVKKELHSLNRLVTEILTDYQLKYTGAGVQLKFDERTTDDIVTADAFHFTTLLLNILDNAVKYNHQPVKQITLRTLAGKEGLQLLIRDNGIGMNKATLQHIFEKFYRYKKDLTNHVKGLGLGLYYVKQCIDAHQWKIKVESEPANGSTFTITIPQKPQHHEVQDLIGRGRNGPGQRYTAIP